VLPLEHAAYVDSKRGILCELLLTPIPDSFGNYRAQFLAVLTVVRGSLPSTAHLSYQRTGTNLTFMWFLTGNDVQERHSQLYVSYPPLSRNGFYTADPGQPWLNVETLAS
jgi:hypothetical protein